MNPRMRVLVAALSMSVAGFGAWKTSESFTTTAIIPTIGDVPTIGHGSTHYEDGTPVKMTDKITPERAEILAKNLIKADEKRFAATLPGVKLYQEEFDLYLNFVGQFGMGNWRGSSMRRHLQAGEYVQACDALLMYRFSARYDCSTLINGQPNRRCWGVWTRQLERHDKCMAAQ